MHIRIQQRNGRKTLTTVQGLSDAFDKKRIVRALKKVRQMKYDNTSNHVQAMFTLLCSLYYR